MANYRLGENISNAYQTEDFLYSEYIKNNKRSYHVTANKWGKFGNSVRFHVLWLQNHYSDCGHDIKRHLLLGRIAMSNLESVFF